MKKSVSYRIQQALIFIIHILLLWWIYWLLQNTGRLSTTHALYHFMGVAIYGALLIRGCAAWAKHHHEKELEQLQKEQEINEYHED